MDHFKNIWQRRKSQRAADDAKNEAAQILTALSTSGGLGAQPEESPLLLGHSTTPGLIHSSSLNASMSNNKTTFVDLESFAAEGKMQPFTVSVSTSAWRRCADTWLASGTPTRTTWPSPTPSPASHPPRTRAQRLPRGWRQKSTRSFMGSNSLLLGGTIPILQDPLLPVPRTVSIS